MSTKIFNGYRWSNPNGQTNVFELSKLFKQYVTSTATRTSHKKLVEEAVKAVDINNTNPPPLDTGFTATGSITHDNVIVDNSSVRSDGSSRRQTDSNKPVVSAVPLVIAGMAVDEQVAKAKAKNEHCSFDCSVQIAILPDEANPQTLLFLVYSNQNYDDTIRLVPGVEPYGYWDNTDAPDDVPAQQWQQRKATWSRCLGWDTPVERGVLWETPDLPLSWVSLLDKQPGWEQNIDMLIPSAHRRAVWLVQHQALKNLGSKSQQDGNQNLVVRVVKTLREAAEAQETIQATKETLPVLTAKDILGQNPKEPKDF